MAQFEPGARNVRVAKLVVGFQVLAVSFLYALPRPRRTRRLGATGLEARLSFALLSDLPQIRPNTVPIAAGTAAMELGFLHHRRGGRPGGPVVRPRGSLHRGSLRRMVRVSVQRASPHRYAALWHTHAKHRPRPRLGRLQNLRRHTQVSWFYKFFFFFFLSNWKSAYSCIAQRCPSLLLHVHPVLITQYAQ